MGGSEFNTGIDIKLVGYHTYILYRVRDVKILVI